MMRILTLLTCLLLVGCSGVSTPPPTTDQLEEANIALTQANEDLASYQEMHDKLTKMVKKAHAIVRVQAEVMEEFIPEDMQFTAQETLANRLLAEGIDITNQ